MDAFKWIESPGGWSVLAGTVMPNHVHCLIFPGEQHKKLERLLNTVKGYTAREANKILRLTGQPFWVPESFDHWCRSSDKVRSVANYICRNPLTAKFVKDWREWPWTRVDPSLAPDQAG